MDAVHPLDGRPVPLGLQIVPHVNALDHQHPLLLADLPAHVGHEVVRRDDDSARCQRAGKGARQSATGGGHHVIQRRGVGLLVAHLHAVMLGDRAVDPEQRRLRLRRKGRAAQPTTEPAYDHLRRVNG